jgi:hypothetical protein
MTHYASYRDLGDANREAETWAVTRPLLGITCWTLARPPKRTSTSNRRLGADSGRVTHAF